MTFRIKMSLYLQRTKCESKLPPILRENERDRVRARDTDARAPFMHRRCMVGLVGWLWKTKNAKKCSATFFPSEFVYSQKKILVVLIFQLC